MTARSRFTAGHAVLEIGGCVEPPAVPPQIRGRPHLRDTDSPDAPDFLAPPRADFPLLARPATGTIAAPLKEWAAAGRGLLDARLGAAAAVLLRGLPIASPADFSEFFHSLGYEPMRYIGVATREEVAPGVFTTNTSKPLKTIMLRNEMAAERILPAHLFLFCGSAPPPGAGGETPIARNSSWRAELGPELMERFEKRGLTRLYRFPSRGQGAGTSWQDRYGTDDRRQVEAACANAGDVVEWGADGSLSASRHMDALVEHGDEKLWFGTLPNARPETSLEICYADNGEPVEDEIVVRTRICQWRIAVAVSWKQGDVLCIDNLACQHGRLSFSENADRGVFVAIATPTRGLVRTPA